MKALADPTRLRLVALLSHGELNVGELCRVLDQSQPRVSRHLRLLTEAGYLDRFRQHQCVYYRVPASGARLGWTRTLLSGMDAEDPTLRRDWGQRALVIAERLRSGQHLMAWVQRPAAERV
jgi:DNA-binding transcriptional ArsR family regulator